MAILSRSPIVELIEQQFNHAKNMQPPFFFVFFWIIENSHHPTFGRGRQEAAEPLLHAALKGGRSSLIFFGQTGTGKTYTARGVLEAERGWKCENSMEKKPPQWLVCWGSIVYRDNGMS